MNFEILLQHPQDKIILHVFKINCVEAYKTLRAYLLNKYYIYISRLHITSASKFPFALEQKCIYIILLWE